MDRRSKKIATGYKARVAMIYSWSSRASHNEACYLGGRLQLGSKRESTRIPHENDMRDVSCVWMLGLALVVSVIGQVSVVEALVVGVVMVLRLHIVGQFLDVVLCPVLQLKALAL